MQICLIHLCELNRRESSWSGEFSYSESYLPSLSLSPKETRNGTFSAHYRNVLKQVLAGLDARKRRFAEGHNGLYSVSDEEDKVR